MRGIRYPKRYCVVLLENLIAGSIINSQFPWVDEICLRYCLQQDWIDKIVIGVDDVKQLNRLASFECLKTDLDITGFNILDENLIHPFLWSKK